MFAIYKSVNSVTWDRLSLSFFLSKQGERTLRNSITNNKALFSLFPSENNMLRCRQSSWRHRRPTGVDTFAKKPRSRAPRRVFEKFAVQNRSGWLFEFNVIYPAIPPNRNLMYLGMAFCVSSVAIFQYNVFVTWASTVFQNRDWQFIFEPEITWVTGRALLLECK